jgi:hypothetical protein
MDPEDPCICRHERKWHAACSQCWCPWFCRADAPTDVKKAWRADGAVRKAKETPR